MKFHFFTRFIVKLIFLLRYTYRYKFVNPEIKNHLLQSIPKTNYLYAFWHQNAFMAFCVTVGSPHISITSPSRDGDIVADILTPFGYEILRGSSSRGGLAAMLEMIHAMKAKNIPGGFGIDGPKGPLKIPKYGIFKIAQRTGVPILPLCLYPKSFWEFNSWDKFRLPKPFTTIYVFYGQPIYVDSKWDKSQLPELSQQLKDVLDKAEVSLQAL